MQVAQTFTIEGFRRASERKEYKAEVSFSSGSKCFPAILVNVSTGGALLYTLGLPVMMPGTEITVTIPYAARDGWVKKNGVIMWTQGERFGIQFI